MLNDPRLQLREGMPKPGLGSRKCRFAPRLSFSRCGRGSVILLSLLGDEGGILTLLTPLPAHLRRKSRKYDLEIRDIAN